MNRPINLRTYTRAVVAATMIVLWSVSALTGVLRWLAPTGPRSGQIPLWLGLTKNQWGDVHFWFSVAAVTITAIHIVIDWRALMGCMRYLASAHRDPELRQ